ncbi:MAG: hypothetical protein WD015_01480 [Gaiellaceae bacterium]
MTQFGTLRLWAGLLTMIGVLAVVLAGIGTVIWAIEVDGFWRTIGVILIGGPVSVLLGAVPIAVAQALRALADIGDTVSAR